jgi:PAS domain S-box-containing protein
MPTPVRTEGAGRPLRVSQSALELSESRYRRLFETAQDAILILDAEERPGTIMDANPFVIDLLGYSLAELVGKELWEIGLFADKAESQAAMERLQRDGYIRYHESEALSRAKDEFLATSSHELRTPPRRFWAGPTCW